jgi:hypothetical protein
MYLKGERTRRVRQLISYIDLSMRYLLAKEALLTPYQQLQNMYQMYAWAEWPNCLTHKPSEQVQLSDKGPHGSLTLPQKGQLPWLRADLAKPC